MSVNGGVLMCHVNTLTHTIAKKKKLKIQSVDQRVDTSEAKQINNHNITTESASKSEDPIEYRNYTLILKYPNKSNAVSTTMAICKYAVCCRSVSHTPPCPHPLSCACRSAHPLISDILPSVPSSWSRSVGGRWCSPISNLCFKRQLVCPLLGL